MSELVSVTEAGQGDEDGFLRRVAIGGDVGEKEDEEDKRFYIHVGLYNTLGYNWMSQDYS